MLAHWDVTMSDDINERREENTVRVWERHVHTLLMLFISGMLFWLTTTASANQVEIAKMVERVGNVEYRIEELKVSLKANMQDRFTGSDGKRIERDIIGLESRIRDLEALAAEYKRGS